MSVAQRALAGRRNGCRRGRPNGHEPERALGTHDAHRRRRPEPLVGRDRCGTGRGQPRARTGEQQQREARPRAREAVREVQAGRRGAPVSTRPETKARPAGVELQPRLRRAQDENGYARGMRTGTGERGERRQPLTSLQGRLGEAGGGWRAADFGDGEATSTMSASERGVSMHRVNEGGAARRPGLGRDAREAPPRLHLYACGGDLGRT